MSADNISVLPEPDASETSALPWASAASNAIALYAQHTAGFEARVAATVAWLREAAEQHPGSVVLANSLGAEDMVLTDLIARHKLPIAIGTLQTGALHAETLALIPQIEKRYQLPVELYEPRNEAVVQFVRKNGEKAMYQSLELRKGCCHVRKLEPLGRMLEGRSAWVTGLRREQSQNRGEMPASEVEANGRTKYNPLVDWTWADIWHYIEQNNVPYNALHDQFMPSIGCAPCTRAIAVGEEFRAGRWWWEDEKAKECGLHVRPETETAEA
ncbi:MAG TPA: phosphoadenylyl-sulfate reductase [Ideonella sp.]|uniref:phosphoadenylyl-sulfate reductase n=1 Tax=Ideonella sp. TaxID=1929293 RepID=UPI002C938BE1|nr:phosphoadenylyl-sulfate reductase [Ideonella sp.]HSI50886.1 phosphoadenylyl-sulfate reductase [Ideonella sp.]